MWFLKTGITHRMLLGHQIKNLTNGNKFFITSLCLGTLGIAYIFNNVELWTTSAALFFMLLFCEWNRVQVQVFLLA